MEKKHFTPEDLTEHLGNLVRQNILAYDPTMATYCLQGKCMELGLTRYIKTLAQKSDQTQKV